MEKKQITNSSTVSRPVKDPHRDQGWEPPCLGVCHAQPFSPILLPSCFPTKERSLEPSCGPVTTSQQDHLLGPRVGLGASFKRTSPR